MENIFDIRFSFEQKVKDAVIFKFSNKQGGSYNVFSYHWQCFAWAATIGFLRNDRRLLTPPIADKPFSLATMKSHNGEKVAESLICMCIAKSGSLDIMKEPADAINMINEYANGGFYYIMKLMRNGENTFNDLEKVKQEIFSRGLDNDVESLDVDDDYSDDTTSKLSPDVTIINDDDNEEESIPSLPGSFAEPELNFTVENTTGNSFILDVEGKTVSVVDGKLKIFHGKIYRFNLKPMCLTVKDVIQDDGKWVKGSKKLVAYAKSDLFPIIDNDDFVNQIEDFREGKTLQDNKIRVEGKWYSFEGEYLG